MVTRKKNTDPGEAGLSAIEQALGLSETDANREQTMPAPGNAPGGDKSVKMPKVDDFDIFKGNPDAKSATASADLSAKRDVPASMPDGEDDAPFKRVTPRKGPADTTGLDIPGLSVKASEQDKTSRPEAPSRPEPTVRLDERPVKEPDARRASILPANDDRRVNVSDMLAPLRQPAPRTPYIFAALLSAVWLLGAYLWLSRQDGLILNAEGTLRAGQEGLLIILGIAALLPILFFFSLASLHRRSREMRTTSRVMAEVAARLAEPEVVGSDTVFTLGQAVRREVSSIGDGIDRAVSRATELESLVHGEVSALERSYADNEYKMRALVTGLSAEREAIMATAERIRLTIDAAHQGFAADIEKASSNISGAITEAGTRVTFLVGGKQDELVATLDRSAAHASDLIALRTTELAEKITAVSRDTSDTLNITGNAIMSDLNRISQNTTAALAEQTAAMASEIETASERAREAMRASGDDLVTGWRSATDTTAQEMAAVADQSARLLRESAEQSAATFRSVSDEATGAFRSTAEEATERFNLIARDSASVVTGSVEKATAEFVGTVGSSTAEIADKVARAVSEFNEAARQSAAEMSASAEGATAGFRAAGDAIRAEIGETAVSVSAAFESNGRVLIGEISNTAAQVSAELETNSRALIEGISTTTATVNTSFETNGRALIEGINSTADMVNANFAANGRAILADIAETASGVTTALDERSRALIGEISNTAETVSSALAANSRLVIDEVRETASAVGSAFETNSRTIISDINATASVVNSTFEANSRTIIGEINETAAVVNSAFETNSRSIMDQIGQRAVELHATMQDAGSAFISTIEDRGSQAARRIEDAGTGIAERIAQNAEELAGHANVLSTHIKGGTDRLEALLDGHEAAIAQSFASASERLDSTLSERATRLDQALAFRATGIEQILQERAQAIDSELANRAALFADLLTTRVSHANEAFSIAGENLGAVIADRTREASLGLKDEIDQLGLALAQQSTLATERLAATGRDVVQAMTTHGIKINDTLAANAQRLSETVTQRTAGLGDRLDSFEKIFVAKAAEIESTVGTRGEELISKLDVSAGAVSGNLESLVSRIETGLDSRTKSLADAIALRTIEFNRLVNENSAMLLGGLDERVGLFTTKVVEPLDQQVAALEARASRAAEEIAGRLDRSADAIVLRANEVQRGLTDMSRDVSAEIVGRAAELSRELSAKSDAIATLFDTKGSGFLTTFETRARHLVEGLESSTTDLTARVTASMDELNAAITSGSTTSLNGLVDANNRLKSEVSELLGRLGDANGLLNTIVGAASQNLTNVESRMAERVRGLESTLAAILSAADQGSDKLSARVEAIRAASGDMLRHSEGLTHDLDGRATTLQRLARDLASTQETVSRLVNERQDAFEALANTLQTRIEDMDSMLRSFSALVDEQLDAAQAKAREASTLVHETAETAAQAIGQQYDRLRLESGKERERTAVALRSAYDQANGEMSGFFQRATDGFMATAAELRQATREMMADLDATRAALATSGLQIPREVTEATANLKRVVGDQARALHELSEIVSRSNLGLDVGEPRRAEPRMPEVEPLRTSLRAPMPRPQMPLPPREPAPPRERGGSWLSGLLERASDEPTRSMPSSANRIESLDSLSVDIARMIDHEAAVDLWDRYRKGERNVFTRRLYTLQGQEAYDDVRRRYRRDGEFKRTVDAYLEQFERLLAEVAGDDRDSLVARTYLTSDTGKVYTMLAHAAGRFD